jgi:hypothetical protein
MEDSMSEKADLAWEKAAECQAHALAATDNKLKAMFVKLRQSWIRIGNDAQFERDQVARVPSRVDAAPEL